ncbi:hypothetical protein PLESTF_001634700 [Pleodorina starrii]|nr:hypothetical protein PLESTF_001634700 [Pleodorina starrii]
MATTSLELTVEKFIVATNKRCKMMEDWQGVEEKSLEKEVTKAVKAYLVKAGFTDVKDVALEKLVGADGDLLIEFDELLSARKDGQLFLVTVEAKHKITTEKIQDRIEQNNKFEMFLSELQKRTFEELLTMDPTEVHTQNCLVLYGFVKGNAAQGDAAAVLTSKNDFSARHLKCTNAMLSLVKTCIQQRPYAAHLFMLQPCIQFLRAATLAAGHASSRDG